MNEKERIKELVGILSEAARHYYANDEEIMSNFEYDKLYDELSELENKTGIILSNSPTQKVGYESVDSLPKQRHAAPMLSLSKTKSREELREWLLDKTGLLSWKLDGLTVVLTYENGELSNAVTRGNGEIGEVVTNNAKCFINLPLKISFREKLILRGEAVITYSDFEQINRSLDESEMQYKNPRNLCSGSVRQLNNRITAQRRVRFFAFSLVEAGEREFGNSVKNQMEFLASLGFDIVPFREVDKENIEENIEWFANAINEYDVPSDGLVLTFDDIAFGKSLGKTAKFPRNSIAFKWADEIRETTLKEIEWSPSRTGLINPVAIFEPVELEGTTVSRASVHNVSVMRSLKLGIGDRITVYKANMIIPQIAENLTMSDSIEIPQYCPACGGETKIEDMQGVQTLYCTNPDCPVKHVKALTLFVSRDALNVDGLSESTIEKFTEKGFIREYADFFRLQDHKDEIIQMEGFGKKSYDNLIESVEKARNTNLAKLLYGLGIANIGVAMGKVLCKEMDYDLDTIRNASVERMAQIEGIGEVIAAGVYEYFHNERKMQELENLLPFLNLEKPKIDENSFRLKGKTFVVTGTLNHFHDRSELKEIIEAMGGKVSGSVSLKTECLINNDVHSTSSKNKNAQKLGVAILSEEEFMEKYGVEGTLNS